MKKLDGFPDVYDATFFYTLCNLMADFQHDRWTYNRLNVRKVKYLSKQLKDELEKSIDVLFDKSIDGDFSEIADQFIKATMIMEKNFKIGMKMQELDDQKKKQMSEKIETILNEYLYENERKTQD